MNYVLRSQQPLHILAAYETKLDSSITDGQIKLSGYNVVRSNRNKPGGGVCIMSEVPSVLGSQMIYSIVIITELFPLEIRKPN